MARGHSVGVAALAMSPLRVSLAGTGVSTMVDSRGRFSLKGLPVGPGRLSVQGQGVDARVAVDLHEGRALQLALRVSGQNAKVECEHEVEEPEGTNNETEGEGGLSKNTCDDGQTDDVEHDDGDGQSDDGEQGGSSGGQ
jgi:hypothetical protein